MTPDILNDFGSCRLHTGIKISTEIVVRHYRHEKQTDKHIFESSQLNSKFDLT